MKEMGHQLFQTAFWQIKCTSKPRDFFFTQQEATFSTWSEFQSNLLGAKTSSKVWSPVLMLLLKKKSAFTWPFLFLLGSEIELLNSQIPLNSLQILIKNLFGLKVGPSSAKITTNTTRTSCLPSPSWPSVAALHPSTLMWHIGRAPPYYHVPGSLSSTMVGQVYIWNYPEFPKSFPD